MDKKTGLIAAICLAGLMAGGAVAAPKGDPEAGRAKAAPCGGCHGPDGNSVVPMNPKLAGMPEEYIVAQLKAFKEGRRKDPVMSGMVAPLSEQDMHDIGAFYERQKLGGDTSGDDRLQQLLLGERLYFRGNAETGMAACVGCHGKDGRGLDEEPSIPPLRGQHADYVYKMLKAFKGGLRSNDEEQMMRRIAERMSEKEMRALAAYVSNMPRR